jgi:hypothetical protein
MVGKALGSWRLDFIRRGEPMPSRSSEKIVFRGPWVVLQLPPDFERRVPACCSGATIITNLRYPTIMSRPCPFENLRTIGNPPWSFVVAESET